MSIQSTDLDALGNNFEKITKGFVDFLLLDAKGFPLLVLSDTDRRYLELVMRTKKQHLNDIAPQAAQKNIHIEVLKTVEIPLPPLTTQQSIVAEIEAEQALVNANRELIIRFEKKNSGYAGEGLG